MKHKQMKRTAVIFLLSLLFAAKSVIAIDSQVLIKDADSESQEALQPTQPMPIAINERSENVSKYGTFGVIQTPVRWFGKMIDGIVFGFQKTGSAIISLPAKTAKAVRGNKAEGGPNAEEKNKKEESNQ